MFDRAVALDPWPIWRPDLFRASLGGYGFRDPVTQGSLRFALGFIPSPLRSWNPVNKTTLRCGAK